MTRSIVIVRETSLNQNQRIGIGGGMMLDPRLSERKSERQTGSCPVRLDLDVRELMCWDISIMFLHIDV